MLWAVEHNRLAEVKAAIRSKHRGEPAPVPKRKALPASARRLVAQTMRPSDRGQQQASIAVLNITGIIEWNPLFYFGDSCDLSLFAAEFKAAVQDARTEQIILWVDSPGGCVLGVEETAQQIYKARDVKPITAFIAGCACSAGYWLASAASRVVSMPSAETGSIGVYSLLFDESQAFKNEGVSINIFKAPPLKTAMSGLEPPAEEAVKIEQAKVDDTYQRFLKAVARYRGKSASTVEATFGSGLTVEARAGLSLGMVDELAMPDAFVDGVLRRDQERQARRAANAKLQAQYRRDRAALAREIRKLEGPPLPANATAKQKARWQHERQKRQTAELFRDLRIMERRQELRGMQ